MPQRPPQEQQQVPSDLETIKDVKTRPAAISSNLALVAQSSEAEA